MNHNRAILALLLMATCASQARSERDNIKGIRAIVVLPTSAADGTTTLAASTPVTTTAFPVGKIETVAYGILVSNLGPTDTVTVTTLATGSSRAALLPYAVEVGESAQRIISANGGKVYSVTYPSGVEELQFTVEAGPGAGANVRMVVSGQ